MNTSSIGIFDSGVGGISVWKAVKSLLPKESIIYFADSQNAPYGYKSQEDIILLSKRVVDFFIQSNVKLVVVACNTATAAAIDFLRQNYNIPFVGMEPAVKPASLLTQNNKIGVLATAGTLKGRLFNDTSKKYTVGKEVYTAVGEGFVELVEQGDWSSQSAQKKVEKVLLPLIEKGIDHLVLACTHYPFLRPLMEQVIHQYSVEAVQIIDPAIPVAKQVLNLLKQNNDLNNEAEPYYQFYSSGTLRVLKNLVEEEIKGYSFHFSEV